MTAQIIHLTDAIEARDRRHWDAAARAVGFKDYAALEEAYEAEFDAQYERLQANCTHVDKHPDLGMCEHCAGLLQV